ncbi:MAG: RDD family protein [Planctomycetes bacterium]|nr:RDD family protein [Planctomycetota bacterium]
MDEFDIIETPENVDLQRRLAGIGSRFAAGLIDHLLIGLMLAALIVVTLLFHVNPIVLGTDLAEQFGAVAVAVLTILFFLIYWGYFFFFELWMNGQTPGKKSLKIRVVRLEGGAITFDSIAVRNLLRVVDVLGFYGVAGIAMFLTRKSQRLGDLAAGTVVISEDVPDYAANSDSKQKVLDDQPVCGAALTATRLTPQEYRLLHNYWLRREQLTIEARRRLLPQLMAPILTRLGESVPADSPAVLEARLESLILQREGAPREEAVPPPPTQGDAPQAEGEDA